MKRNIIILISAALMSAAIAQTGRAEFITRMSGAGKAKAVWKTRDSATQLQGELEVEGERMARNMAVTVVIAGSSWSATTDALGRFRITQRYNSAVRPNIGLGTVAVVKNAAGATILNGTFVAK